MKKCTECKKNKQLSEFAKKRKGLATRCKACHRAWCKKHYASNKPYYKNKNKSYRQTVANKLREYKEARPCTDCKLFYPACVMDFDHLENGKKSFNVGTAVYTGKVSWAKTLLEIQKCELVCANCHRVRTFNRKLDGWSSNG